MCCKTPGSDTISTRFVDALANEQRGDQIGHRDVGLGDEIAQRRRCGAGAAGAHREVGEVGRHGAGGRPCPHRTSAHRDRPTSMHRSTLGMSSRCRTRPLLSAVVSVQAWFAQDEMTIRPGSTTSLSLSIENLGEHTEAYTIIPAGLTAAWTTVTRPNVTLFGGSRDVVEIVIRPPAIHTTTAGPTPASVRVIPQQQPDEAIVAETMLDVQSFDDRRITMLQPLQRGRRRATYEFMVENHGNNLASCRLHLVDRTERVDGSFDPPAVGVAPGSQSLVRLRLKAEQRPLPSQRTPARLRDRGDRAGSRSGDRACRADPATVDLGPFRLARRSSPRRWWVPRGSAWVHVVEPETARCRRAGGRRSTRRARNVADRDVASPSTSSPVTPWSPTTLPAVPVVEGEPFTTRIVVDVAIGQTGSQGFSVPPDSAFALTDLVIQNPNRDVGTATLLQNSDTLYAWNLAQLQSNNEFQPRVTELVFQPSDTIVLQVTCEGAGSTVGTGCSVAVLLSGEMRPTG